jgi:predicted ATP-dependent endonuclease of OLD family
MNVLIGKNSSGKSSILEAIDFLLSTNNANVPPKEIIPYNMRENQTVHARIDGYFEMSDFEKDSLCTILDNSEDRDKVKESHLELIYTKSIYKKIKLSMLSQV